MRFNPSTIDSLRSTALLHWLRARWQQGIPCPSDIVFAFGISLLWALLYNARFWQQAIAAMWHPGAGANAFVVSMLVLVVCLQAILMLLMPTRALMRAAASVLFIVAAASSYFSDTYGAILNRDMMRNVLQTDPAEVRGLLSFGLLTRLLLLGAVPALLVWRVRLPERRWLDQLQRRVIFIMAALGVCAAGLFAFSADYAVFFREHKPVRFTLSPVAAISSTAGLLIGNAHGRDRGRPLQDLAGTVQRIATPHSKPRVLFLVIGETARAENFQLGGYGRATNPRLMAIDDLVYFKQTLSCGTSTAISVPCLFSSFARADFDVDQAPHYTNLLDTLAKAGLDVEWRDNNAGCKGVCARVAYTDYSDRPDIELCPQSYCYDEIMLTDLAQRLRTLRQDTVIVFHQIGSHGPAYFERYPPQFETFQPACRSNQLQRCTSEEIRNAYDNTIVYTDYVLSRQIDLLRTAADHVEGILLYVSDHGESLGEQGIYLHGMPYAFAPRSQKEVPMLLWTPAADIRTAAQRTGCLRSQAEGALSHDNVYHTVLGLMQVRDRRYDPALDLLSLCTQPRAALVDIEKD
jgi:lipid A ethanolaminephosphotransferase